MLLFHRRALLDRYYTALRTELYQVSVDVLVKLLFCFEVFDRRRGRWSLYALFLKFLLSLLLLLSLLSFFLKLLLRLFGLVLRVIIRRFILPFIFALFVFLLLIFGVGLSLLCIVVDYALLDRL